MSHIIGEVKSWLEHLDYIMPCRGVLVAGSGFGSWVAELDALNIPRALFVEAQNSKIERMKKLYDLPQNWQIVQGVLWSEEAEVSFYEASNSALSGLIATETFREVWPNATTINVESCHTTTLKSILEVYDGESRINWLVVDCFPAVKILQGALEKLDKYDVILARAISEGEFIDDIGLPKKELHTFLEEQGFRQIVTFEDTNPSVGLVLYVRDVNMTIKKELEIKTDELKFLHIKQKEQRVALERKIAQTEQEQIKIQETLAQQNTQVTKEKDTQIETLTKELEIKAEELKLFQTKKEEQKVTFKNELAQTKQEQIKIQETLAQQSTQVIKEKDAQIETLKKELEVQTQSENKKMADIIDKLENLEKLQVQVDKVATVVSESSEKEIKYLQTIESRISNAITKSTANVTKQVESFVSLQNYLAHGVQPLNFHGWPISPDIALFLIQKIEQYHYDLIIEFGSGTSTALIGNILKKRAAIASEPSNTKLVTFEHNKKYYEQTLQNLNAQSLGDYVDLVHAPLIDYAHQEENFLYYSCEQKISELKVGLRNTQQTILVLVDGPPGATGPLARFPALPHLLSQFSDQEIHLLVDDYDRAEEKAITQKWEQILGERSIDFQSESIPSEKGLYFCQIN